MKSVAMVRRTLIVAVLTVLTSGAARADLFFSETRIEAGKARAGAPLAHQFHFVNRGPESVEIVGVHTDCGCLTSSLDRKVYHAGEAGSIALEVNTLTQSAGRHRWPLEVTYRTGDRTRDARLELDATIEVEIAVEPTAVVLFADGSAGHELSLTDLRATPLRVTEVRSSSPQLQAHLAERSQDPEGHVVQRVRFELAADYPAGRRTEMLEIATDDPVYRRLKVPVTVAKRPRGRVTAVPSEVTLSPPAGQAAPSRIILLRDGLQKPVRVTAVHCDDPAVTCRWAQGPGAMATLRISVDRSRIGSVGLSTAVHVHVDEPVSQEISIPIACPPP